MSRRHLPEGALVALLDDEMDGTAAETARAHLALCADCSARLEALERADRRVRDWMTAHDPAPPPRDAYEWQAALGPRTRRASKPGALLSPRLRWAAAASLVLAIAVAAGPARAWILDQIGLDDRDVPAEEAGPLAGHEPGTAGTSFSPTSPEVRIDLTDIGGARELTVAVHDGPRVHLLVPEGDVEVLVRPGGLEVRDPSRTHHRYRLDVPASVLRVRLVRPGPAGDTVLVPPAPGGTLVIPVRPHTSTSS